MKPAQAAIHYRQTNIRTFILLAASISILSELLSWGREDTGDIQRLIIKRELLQFALDRIEKLKIFDCIVD